MVDEHFFNSTKSLNAMTCVSAWTYPGTLCSNYSLMLYVFICSMYTMFIYTCCMKYSVSKKEKEVACRY